MKTKLVGWNYVAGGETLLDPFDLKGIDGALPTPQDAINLAVRDLKNNSCKTVKGLVKITIELVPIKERDLK